MNSIDDISVVDYQALAEFRYQIRRFLRFSEQAARATGLVPQQYQFLLALKGLPNGRKATISELAERLQIKHHSTVELIDRLVERDLIRRSRDDQDQRRVIIHLNPHGEQLLKKLSLLHRNELQSTGPILVRTLKALVATDSDTSEVSLDGIYQSQERLEELP